MNKGLNIFSLKGKTALITGATGHLGSAMAFILAEAGARVLINSRSTERVTALVKKMHKAGYLADGVAFDITCEKAVKNFAANLEGQALDILINNAYVGGAGTIELSDAAPYTASYDITMVAAHRLVKALLPNLRLAAKTTGGASIINLASMYALVSPDQRIYEKASGANPPFYGAAKAALLHWTRYAACELGKEGIRVNAISPGPFPSLSVQKTNPSFVAELQKKVPMGRIGSADEIRGATLFLASDASSYVNGANIVVDGGWTCW